MTTVQRMLLVFTLLLPLRAEPVLESGPLDGKNATWFRTGDGLTVALLESEKRLVVYRGKQVVDKMDLPEAGHVSLTNLMEIRAGFPAVVVQTWHDNSSESFDQQTVVGLWKGKLRKLLELPTAYGCVLTFEPEICKQSASFDLAPGQPGPEGVRDLSITANWKAVAHSPTDKWDWDSGVLAETHQTVVARWNPASHAYALPAVRVSEVVYCGQDRLDKGLRGHDPRLTPGDTVRVRYVPDWATLSLQRQGSDDLLKGALAMLRKHYDLMAAGDFKAAYLDLSPARRKLQTQKDFAATNEGARAFPRQCRVLSHTPYQVEVLCLAAELAGEPEPGCYAFTLVRNENAWCIDRIEKRPLKAWVTP